MDTVSYTHLYWEANMELIDIIPEFNLYEEFWKIYTNSEILPPQYISSQSVIERSIIGNGSEIYGEVHNSVIGSGVTIEEGTVVRDSIIMKDVTIGKGCVDVYKRQVKNRKQVLIFTCQKREEQVLLERGIAFHKVIV